MVSIRRSPYEPTMYKHMMLNGYNDNMLKLHLREHSKEYSVSNPVETISERVKLLFRRAHAFNVFNVSDIIRKEPIATANLFPPFSCFWIEGANEPMRGMSASNSKKCNNQYGTLVGSYKKEDNFVFECYSFVIHRTAGTIGPAYIVSFASDEAGNLIIDTMENGEIGFVSKRTSFFPDSAKDMLGGEVDGDMRCDCATVCNFLALINASNISCPQKQFECNHHTMRRLTNKNATRYHVLKIHKPGQKINKDTATGENEGKMPLHVVRGHLADYTENGLFGKYFGTFFIPSHVRGNEKNGKVTKDYALV